MSMLDIVILVAGGLSGGFITAIVGGASLVAFPALLAIGLPPIVANATTSVSISPASLVAALDDRAKWPAWDARFLALAAVTMICSGAGAVLLLAMPERSFTMIVPALIGFATVLFTFGDRIRTWAARYGRAEARAPAGNLNLFLFAPVAFYGGYFGAGFGVLVLSLMAATSSADFRALNVIKNLIGALTSVVAIAIFIVQGVVAWGPALVMMAGALVGGFLGGRLVRYVRAERMRHVVIAVGVAMTVLFAYRYWF